MEQLLAKLFSEFGIISTLFVVLVLSIIWAVTKYIPKVVLMHFEAIRDMQAEYMISLTKIIDKNESTSEKFLKSIEKLDNDHEKQMIVLKSIEKTGEKVHYQVTNANK